MVKEVGMAVKIEVLKEVEILKEAEVAVKIELSKGKRWKELMIQLKRWEELEVINWAGSVYWSVITDSGWALVNIKG